MAKEKKKKFVGDIDNPFCGSQSLPRFETRDYPGDLSIKMGKPKPESESED